MITKLTIRNANLNDADLLLSWRNDEITRKWSFNSQKIDRQTHISWFNSVLKDPNKKLFIAENNGIPVGMVRIDNVNGTLKLSWAVSPEARGQGIGKKMVKMVLSMVKERPLYAEIKKGNVASIKIAEYVGMKLEKKEGNVLSYYTN